jgi:bacteriocin biosynthesis cyclodehydratase domain-containing protein
MTTANPGTGSPLIHVVADGPFGQAVADSLAGLLTAAGATARIRQALTGQPLTRFIAGSNLCVRASWRDVRSEWEEVASAAAAAGRPWLPVGFGHPDVRVGPAVVPGVPPCYACYSVRSRQHSVTASKWADDLDLAFARDPALGVAGFPPHTAAIAAAVALGMLQETLGPAGDRARPGQVTLINCHTDAIRSWRVATTPRCPACHAPASGQDPAGSARADRLRKLAGPAFRSRGSGRARAGGGG